MGTRWRRAAGALAVLALALAMSASEVVAATWGADVKLSSTNTSDQELVRTGPTSAIAVWNRTGTLIARRSTDGGTTWHVSETLATHVGVGLGVASVGSAVDLVYPLSERCAATGEFASRLYYRRSTDGGATWSSPRALTSACSRIIEPDVARSADGQVSVVWTGLETGRILTRTSRDGGGTFGAAVEVATTTLHGADTAGGAGACCFEAKPAVAIGSGGTTYVAYTSAPSTLTIRRSLDRGAHWSSPIRVSPAALTFRPSLVATGSRAVVGYTDRANGRFRAAYRTTADRGAAWSAPRPLVSATGTAFSMQPGFTTDGRVLAAIVKFGPPGSSPIWYRESTDWGATWGSTIRISPAPGHGLDPVPAGIALLSTKVLAGHAENGNVQGLWVRQGSR